MFVVCTVLLIFPLCVLSSLLSIVVYFSRHVRKIAEAATKGDRRDREVSTQFSPTKDIHVLHIPLRSLIALPFKW